MNLHQALVSRTEDTVRRTTIGVAVLALSLLPSAAPHGREVMAAKAPARALSVGGLPVT